MESLQTYGSDSSDSNDDNDVKQTSKKIQKSDPTPRRHEIRQGSAAAVVVTSNNYERHNPKTFINKIHNSVHENVASHVENQNITTNTSTVNNKTLSTKIVDSYKSQDFRSSGKAIASSSMNIRNTNISPSCSVETNSSRSATLNVARQTTPKVRGYVSKRKREQIEKSYSKRLCSDQKEKLETQNVCSDAVSKGTDNIFLRQTVSDMKEYEDFTKHLARTPPKQLSMELQRHSKGVNCVLWNPVITNLLLSASMDQTVCVWNTVGKGECRLQLTCHTGAVKQAEWSDCGLCILSCGYDKSARLSDINTGLEKQKFPHTDYVTCVCFHPNNPNVFLSGTFKSGISSWDMRANKVVSNYQDYFGQVQDLMFLPGGEEFISAAEVVRRNATDKGIMAWDFKSTAVLSNQIYQEAFTCTCLKIHPHGSHFLAQSSGNYVAIFSTKKPFKLNKYKRFEGHQVSGYKIGCDVSLDGSLIASGSTDGNLYIYDHKTSRVLRTLPAYDGVCMDVAFHPGLPSTVATCSWNGNVSVWQ